MAFSGVGAAGCGQNEGNVESFFLIIYQAVHARSVDMPEVLAKLH